MSIFQFESANEGQFLKVIASLSELDPNIKVQSKKELDPYESNLMATIELEANFEQVLAKVTSLKNLDRTLETIRPLQ